MVFIRKHITLLYATALILCFMPFVTPPLALAAGILFSVLGWKHAKISGYTSLALQASIVLMGFGMNLAQVVSASKTGFLETAISVVFVLCTGFFLSRILKVESKTGLLISAGTAICGGSAIAAVAPVIDARNRDISFALIVVFVLNALALIIFPAIGHHFHLSQEVFGNWAAIAIHDTSSVVGAGAAYGPEALEVATTVKLIRALWIIPLSLIIALAQKGKNTGKIKIPWFIALFVLSIVVAHLFPAGAPTFAHLNWLGKRGMMMALFLIGANITFSEIRKAGVRSFILGVLLWLIIGVSSFMALTINA